MDEVMIPFKGQSTLKQYMPQKPVKRGIKVWALADAINGFVSMFLSVYWQAREHSTEGTKSICRNNSDKALYQHIQACLL